ncbi:MAG: hypothetical protein U9M90_02810 [Patescibacteria group bacterium]|nr:hypothetical protein [Patescibacteria group bacterium]
MKKKNGGKEKQMSKLRFLLGLLIVITGGSLMIDLLGLSIRNYTANVGEVVLFPMAMLLLITGIGIVAKNSEALDRK